MELIVLNIGLDLGVISPTLFAMMVVMALVTTAMTAPMLARLVPTAKPLTGPLRNSSAYAVSMLAASWSPILDRLLPNFELLDFSRHRGESFRRISNTAAL
ncbi:MAG: hypothetical protein U0872_10135 [Planctomycetaceae bacterium]